MISYRAMDTRPRQQIMTLIAIALTFASGANDVASFTRLGGVFTSVMTRRDRKSTRLNSSHRR